MKIRYSKRGLTFSFKENETFRVGTKYRYIVDLKSNEIILIPDQKNGKYTISRKGENNKPLVDLRNKEIKNAISLASYMEIEIQNDKIIVHIYNKDVNIDTTSEINLVNALSKEEDITYEISKKDLISNDSALLEMLKAGGLFSAQTCNDISCVFDVVSLFSGAGLLDLPFKEDNCFDIKFACDFDKFACETYRKNIGDHIICMDIRDLHEDDVPYADVIIGGVCCQGYSNANRNGNESLNKDKRLLVDDFIRIVKYKKPLVFCVENVPQFITKENGLYLNKVLELQDEYEITYSVINDHDYGGFTTRKRMILLGSLKKLGKIIIPNIELAKKKTVRDALRRVTSDWFNYSDITKPSASTVEKMIQVRPGHNYKDIQEMAELDRHSNVYRRLSYDEPAVTLTNWRKVNLMPPEGNRILSVAEAASLMGLDKTFKVLGNLNSRQQQIGNGVTQAIASFVKAIIKNHLMSYSKNLCLV